MKSTLLTLIIVLLFSCQREKQHTSITDRWIRVDAASDTIEFKSDLENLFTLKRGYSTNAEGLRIPLAKSGMYDFKVQGDSISLYWTLSSSSARNKYYFRQQGNQLEIGNFIDGNTTVLTFQKK